MVCERLVVHLGRFVVSHSVPPVAPTLGCWGSVSSDWSATIINPVFKKKNSIKGAQVASSLCQRGENRASVLTVFENTHILSVACTSYVTSLGWGVGHVNVHVNLRHMHILRYVTGLGGVGDVNIHVNLRHMHILRYVTGGMLTFMLT